MIWYKKLYTGEAAKKRRFSIIQKLRSGAASASVYVVVPAANSRNLLDIYSAPNFYLREKQKPQLILGIAWGYPDALNLAGKMVDELYRATGGFDFWAYLGLGEYDFDENSDVVE